MSTMRRTTKRRVLMVVRTDVVVLYEGGRLLYVEQGNEEDSFEFDTRGGSTTTGGGGGSSTGGGNTRGGTDRITLDRTGIRGAISPSHLNSNKYNNTIPSSITTSRRRLVEKNGQQQQPLRPPIPALDTSYRLRGSSSSSVPYVSVSMSHRQTKRAPPGIKQTLTITHTDDMPSFHPHPPKRTITLYI